MKTFGKLLVTGAVVFVLFQVVRPSIPTGPAQADLDAPPDVRHRHKYTWLTIAP